MAEFNRTEGIWVVYDIDSSMMPRYISSDPIQVIIEHSNTGYGHIMFWPEGMSLEDAIEWWGVEKARYVSTTEPKPVRREQPYFWLVTNASRNAVREWARLNADPGLVYHMVSTVQDAEGARMTEENTAFLEPVDPEVRREVEHNIQRSSYESKGEVNGNTTETSPDQTGGESS